MLDLTNPLGTHTITAAAPETAMQPVTHTACGCKGKDDHARLLRAALAVNIIAGICIIIFITQKIFGK